MPALFNRISHLVLTYLPQHVNITTMQKRKISLNFTKFNTVVSYTKIHVEYRSLINKDGLLNRRNILKNNVFTAPGKRNLLIFSSPLSYQIILCNFFTFQMHPVSVSHL